MTRHRMRYVLIAVVFTLMALSSAMGQSARNWIAAEGVVIAYHKEWRHAVDPVEPLDGMGTPVDIWIIRVDNWESEGLEGRYFLAAYWQYEHAVSDDDINKNLRFRVRKPDAADGKDPCEGITSVGSGPPFESRAMEMDDFRRTEQGQSDSIPLLKDMPCLIIENAPTPQS